MLPLASASGPAIIAIAVISSTLLLWWLLRAETRDEEAERVGQDGAPKAGQDVAPEAEQDRISAP